MDVSVITVTYRCRDEADGLLASLGQAATASTVEIHVADNASADGTEELVRDRYPDADFVQIGYNSGFSRANNAAILRSRGRYLFLLNPDARVTQGCIDALVRFMDANPDVAAVGPRLVDRRLVLQHSIRNLPTLRGSLIEALFLHRAFPRLLERYGETVFEPSAYESPHPVGWVSGAAMFVRRSTVERVGLLDESFFLFAEEIDWFKRMNDVGLQVWFCPDAVVIHREERAVRDPYLTAIDVASRRLYWRKHASRVHAAGDNAVLGLNMGLRYLLWSLIALTGSERAGAERVAFRRGLRALTRSGTPARPEAPRGGPVRLEGEQDA